MKKGCDTRIPKFRRFVIQNFPFIEEDFDALTDYGLICKIVEYLNKVITATNDLTEEMEALNTAFVELKSYVDNYFDNLDVQEEINNKLEEMVESGQLADIIAGYIQLRGILAYDNVAIMKNATNLVDGSFCETYGYHVKGDGGSAKYKIRNITNDDVVDECTIISIDSDTTNNLIAELIPNDYITLEQFGCKDNVDCTEKFRICVNYAKENHLTIKSAGNKTFILNDSIDVTGVRIDLEMSTITGSTTSLFTINGGLNDYTELESIRFDGDNTETCIAITAVYKSKFSNLQGVNVNKFITISSGYENVFSNIRLSGKSNSIGITIDTTDCTFENIYARNLHTAFLIKKGSNIFNQIHCWIGDESMINDSKMFDINISATNSVLFMSKIYNDTYNYGIYFTSTTPVQLKIDEMDNAYNTTFYTDGKNNAYVFYYQSDAQVASTFINNSYGVGHNSSYYTTTFNVTNRKFTGRYINTNFNEMNFDNTFQIENVNANVTVVSNRITRIGNTVTLDFVGSYDAGINGGNDVNFSTFGQIAYHVAPIGFVQTSYTNADSRWDWITSNQCYLYIGGRQDATSAIQLKAKGGTGTKYIMIHETWNV